MSPRPSQSSGVSALFPGPLTAGADPETGSRFLWEAGDTPLQKRLLGYTEDYRDVRRATAVGAEAWRVPALGQGRRAAPA